MKKTNQERGVKYHPGVTVSANECMSYNWLWYDHDKYQFSHGLTLYKWLEKYQEARGIGGREKAWDCLPVSKSNSKNGMSKFSVSSFRGGKDAANTPGPKLVTISKEVLILGVLYMSFN